MASLPVPIIAVDGKDNIAYLNPAAEQFFQGSMATLSGVNLQDIIPHDSPVFALVHKTRRRGYSMSEFGVRLSTPRIGNHTVAVDLAPLGDEPGAHPADAARAVDGRPHRPVADPSRRGAVGHRHGRRAGA